MPRRPLPAGMGVGQARHRHHSIDAQQTGDADRLAQVLRVFRSDLGVGVQRVAVAVQAGEGHSGAVECRQVVGWLHGTGQQVVDGKVRGGEKAARVDLRTGQAE